METKFTKGKWISKKSLYCTIIECGNKHIAALGDSNEEELQANIKLICAAPDLINICERLLEIKDLLLPPNPVRGVSEEYVSEYEAIGELFMLANNAIKKATE